MAVSRLKILSMLGAVAVASVWLITTHTVVQAQSDQDPGKNGRCATRLAVTFLGSSPGANLLQSADPQSKVDELLADPIFQERFARFINSKMNDAPGERPEEDTAYYLSKYVLQNAKPWKDLFIGAYNIVAAGNGANRTVSVQADAEGLGYFRSRPWLLRYAGNELTGLKLNTAYRLQNNVLGLRLTATTNAPGADVSATGRQAAACRGCHYDGWYALDKTALILSKVQRQGQNVTFTPADGQAKDVLGGMTLKDDKELVTAMVNSEQFNFNACQTVFQFLYGRDENSCEGSVFDRCVEALQSTGMIQNALAVVAKDPSFCQ
jgi:hypothetical protein